MIILDCQSVIGQLWLTYGSLMVDIGEIGNLLGLAK